MNIKEFNSKLHHNRRFVLGAVQFLTIKDALKATKGQADEKRVEFLKKDLKKYKDIIIDAMHKSLEIDEYIFFSENFPKLTNASLAKYLTDYAFVMNYFRALYDMSYCYTVQFLKEELTDDLVDNYNQTAKLTVDYFSNEYHW